jgi:hypothetical protein
MNGRMFVRSINKGLARRFTRNRAPAQRVVRRSGDCIRSLYPTLPRVARATSWPEGVMPENTEILRQRGGGVGRLFTRGGVTKGNGAGGIEVVTEFFEVMLG